MPSDATTIPGDLYVNGTLYAAAVNLSDNSVTDAKVAGTAAIGAHKFVHTFRAPFDQEPATNATAQNKTVHVCNGAGIVKAAKVGIRVAAVGGATVTVDIKKNGTSVLTAPISVTSATAAFGLVAGSLDPAQTAVVAGDVLHIEITAAAGGGTLAKGVFGFVQTNEAVAA